MQIVLELILVAGLAIVGIFAFQYGMQKLSENFIRKLSKNGVITFEELEKKIGKKPVSVNGLLPGEDDNKFRSEKNFWSLKSVNPDIVAWIEIPELKIDYPVLSASQAEGIDYYLRRDYERKENDHGSIFVQTGYDYDLNDTVTVIYGHNMKDGTMFGMVQKLEDPDTQRKAEDLYLYYPDKTVKAKYLACYQTDDQLVTNKFNDFKTSQDRMNYIYTFKNTSALCDLKEKDIVNGTEKIITLSTCAAGGERRQLAQYLVTEIITENIGDDETDESAH